MTLPDNWPLFVALLGVSAIVAQFLWANFFNVRATLTKDFSDRVRVAGTRIIADKYVPRLAELLEDIRESGLEPGEPDAIPELTSAEFFDKIIEVYQPLRERWGLDGQLGSLKRRGERVARLGGIFALTLPFSYFVLLWPVPFPNHPYKTVVLTLWVSLLVVAPFCAAVWNLCLFCRDRARLDEALDSLTSD